MNLSIDTIHLEEYELIGTIDIESNDNCLNIIKYKEKEFGILSKKEDGDYYCEHLLPKDEILEYLKNNSVVKCPLCEKNNIMKINSNQLIIKTYFFISTELKTKDHSNYNKGSMYCFTIDGFQDRELILEKGFLYEFYIDAPKYTLYFTNSERGQGEGETYLRSTERGKLEIDLRKGYNLPEIFFYSCLEEPFMGNKIFINKTQDDSNFSKINANSNENKYNWNESINSINSTINFLKSIASDAKNITVKRLEEWRNKNPNKSLEDPLTIKWILEGYTIMKFVYNFMNKLINAYMNAQTKSEKSNLPSSTKLHNLKNYQNAIKNVYNILSQLFGCGLYEQQGRWYVGILKYYNSSNTIRQTLTSTEKIRLSNAVKELSDYCLTIRLRLLQFKEILETQKLIENLSINETPYNPEKVLDV